LLLSGEVCLGVGCAVVAAAPTARIARCGLTGQKSAEVVVPAGIGWGREGLNVKWDGGIGLLVPVAVIAAIPRTRGSGGEETVSSVEHRS
jgi:hypothetical protein